MTKLFLQIHSVFLLYELFRLGGLTWILEKSPDKYVSFAYVLSFFGIEHYVALHAVVIIGSFIALILGIFATGKKIRVSIFVVVNILFAITNSYGKVSHAFLGYMFALLILCFFDNKKNLNDSGNLFLIRLVQTHIVSFYCASSIWKVRFLFAVQGDLLTSINHHILNSVSFSVAEGNGPRKIILDLLMSYPEWVFLGFVTVVLIQLIGIWVVLYRPRGIIYWGLSAVFFHMMTGLTLGIWFRSLALAVSVYFIVLELMLKNEKLHIMGSSSHQK